MNRDAAEIVIDAANYDEIVWISGRGEWRYEIDPETGVRWPPSEVIQRGPVFDYAEMERSLSYVRAEVIRHSDDGPIRLITNPFALAQP